MNNENPSEPVVSHRPGKRQRRTRRTLVIVGILLGLLLIISFAPTYVARTMISNQLDSFGISHEGVDSLVINPWKREAWLETVRFGVSEVNSGQFGEVGIKLSLSNLFDKQAMAERVLIRGVGIEVARAEDNSITLNGIPLDRFIQADPASEDSTQIGLAWGAGLGELELRDSNIVFREKNGGVLRVDIDSLVFTDFYTWTPDDPGHFELHANVNDIGLDLNGETRPFAEHITLQLDARINNAELPKIIEFTGAGFVNLERRAGIYDADIDHNITLYSSGKVEGRTSGTIDIREIDYFQPDSFDLKLDKFSIKFDTSYILGESGDFSLSGNMNLDLNKITSAAGTGIHFESDTGNIDLTEINLSLGANGSDLKLTGDSKIELENAFFSGRVRLSTNMLLEVLSYLQSITRKEDTGGEQEALAEWARGDVNLPELDVTARTVSNHSGPFVFELSQGNVSLDLASKTNISGIEAKSAERETRIEQLDNLVEELSVRAGGGELSLQLNGAGTLLTGNYVSGPVGEGNLESIDVKINSLGFESSSAGLAIDVATEALVKNVAVAGREIKGIPPSKGTLSSMAVQIDNASIQISKDDVIWTARGNALIDDINLEIEGGKVAAARFKKFEVVNAAADHNLNLAGDAVTLAGLDIFLTRLFIDNLLDIGKPKTDVKQPKKLPDNQPVPETGEKTAVSEDGDLPFNLKLPLLAIEDGANIEFNDANTNPKVHVNTVIKSLELRDIDTTVPTVRTQARVEATINEFTKIDINGWAEALGPRANFEIDLNLDNLELAPYSSYAAQFAGINIDSGQLTTSAVAKATNGQLNGGIKLDLDGLSFEPLSEEDAERLKDVTGGVPIETAVKLLQDSEGRIKLTLPVGGTVVKPVVDYSDAINKAIGSVLKLVYPPTLIAGIITSADNGSGMTFKPVQFAPGESELDEEASNYLKNLVTLLGDRPKLSLDVCGRSTASDLDHVAGTNTASAQQDSGDEESPPVDTAATDDNADVDAAIEKYGDKLLKLAKERAHVVRRYLIDEKNITPRRVAECRSTFAPDDSGPPRSDIKL